MSDLTTRETRDFTARIRAALADLPGAIRAGDLDDVREIVCEIQGASAAIADLLDVEL